MRIIKIKRRISYSYCGNWEPTEKCEASGYCDYHAGITPSNVPVGPDPSPEFK